MLSFELFYDYNYLANILSFDAVALMFSITTDIYLEPYINIHLNHGTIIILKQCSRVLYYYVTNNMECNNMNGQVTDYTFMNTL